MRQSQSITQQFRRLATRTALIATLCTGLSGCASLMTSPTQWLKKEPEFVTPHQIVPVWSDTVLHQTGQRGMRGCGGRVMFYPLNSKQAERVDGSLVVYAWDDAGGSVERKPDRKYVFDAEDLQNHYSNSKIGHSYSFWLPWGETGGEKAELTLVARFIGVDGAEVTSSPGKVILPGAVPLPNLDLGKKESNKESGKASGIQQVSFNVSEGNSSDDGVKTSDSYKGLQTTNIDLTEGFLKRNLSGSSQAVYSSNDLFTPNSESESTTSSQVSESHVPAATSDTLNTKETDAAAEGDAQTAAEPNNSLSFRDRVRSSRRAQRSHNFSSTQRFQPKARTAPWKKD